MPVESFKKEHNVESSVQRNIGIVYLIQLDLTEMLLLSVCLIRTEHRKRLTQLQQHDCQYSGK